MDSADLNEQQAKQIHASVASMLRYLDRLERRMRRRGFPENDPLRHYVSQAKVGIHALWIIAYYLSIGDGPRMKLRQEGRATANVTPVPEDPRPLRAIADSIERAIPEE